MYKKKILEEVSKFTKLEAFEPAIELLNEAIKRYPNFFEAYFKRGNVYNDIGKYKKAIDDYTEAIKIDPNDLIVHYKRGWSYYQINKYKEAINDFSESIKLDLNFAGSYFMRGESYLKIGKYPEAISDYTKAINLNPKVANAYYNRALAFNEIKRYEEAIKDISKAIKINPEYELYHFRGMVFYKIGRPNKAIKDFTDAIKIKSDDAKVYVNRGGAYHELGNNEKAIQDYNKAIKIDQGIVYAYLNRGNSLKDLGKLKDALKDFNIALKLDIKEFLVYYNRGNLYNELELYDKAIEDYNKTIELNPRYVEAYNNRGVVHHKLGLEKQAIQDYSKAIKLNPNHLNSYLNRANTYSKTNNYQKAYQDYVIAEELSNHGSELFESSASILQFFSSFNAPLLLYRIINQLYTLETFLSFKELISKNLADCSEVVAILDYHSKSYFIDKNKFQLLRGIIHYYLKDPATCYHIFDNEVDTNLPDSLLGQFYFVLSCDDYLKSEQKPILEYALKLANNVYRKLSSTKSIIQKYYAGQLFLLNRDYNKGLECFKNCADFMPALCMQIICLNLLHDRENRDNLITELLFLDKHNKGLLQYVYIPKLSNEEFEASVMKYSFVREIEGVIPIICKYLEEKNDVVRSLYNDIIEKSSELFIPREDIVEGQKSIVKTEIWKNQIVASFCSKYEEIFNQEIKDHFNLWNKETNKSKLEHWLGSEIPLLLGKEVINNEIINLIDYFSVKNKIPNESRYLLIYWAKLCKQRNKRLTDKEKKIIKHTISYAFKISLGFFTVPYLVPKLILYLGLQLTKEYFTEMVIRFIEDNFIKGDEKIPEFYTDFKIQFTEYLKEALEFKNNILGK